MKKTPATALVEAWYPGGQGGDAVAAVLAGDISPSGRLPITFYKSLDQLPAFNDYSMSNRTYRYHKAQCSTLWLWPSYSSFRYGEIKVQPKQWEPGDTLRLSLNVTNTGNRDAEEECSCTSAARHPWQPVRAQQASSASKSPKAPLSRLSSS